MHGVLNITDNSFFSLCFYQYFGGPFYLSGTITKYTEKIIFNTYFELLSED